MNWFNNFTTFVSFSFRFLRKKRAWYSLCKKYSSRKPHAEHWLLNKNMSSSCEWENIRIFWSRAAGKLGKYAIFDMRLVRIDASSVYNWLSKGGRRAYQLDFISNTQLLSDEPGAQLVSWLGAGNKNNNWIFGESSWDGELYLVWAVVGLELARKVAALEAFAFSWLPQANVHGGHLGGGETGAVRVVAVGQRDDLLLEKAFAAAVALLGKHKSDWELHGRR